MPRRRTSDFFHWPLIISTLAILFIGMVNLFSAAYATRPTYFFSQLAWIGIALVVFAVVVVLDYRVYERMAYLLFTIGIILLVAVLFFRSIGGSHRWIILGPLRLQPSELMKIFIVLALAKYYHNHVTPRLGHTLWDLKYVFVMVLIPMVLIILEPDLGTSLMIAAISFTVLLFTKIRLKTLIALFLVAMILMPIGWKFVLKDYQKKRIATLIDPDSDPRGTGYHRRQSIIAIGSGQLKGKGFREGTQTQLRFLPEQHTDFVFSVWAEEQGFLGAFSVIMAYFVMILSGIHIASKAREKFGALLALGVTSVIFWQIVINIGMVIGLLPVVGVTLPLMSYGGTSVVVTMVCIGMLFNVYARRYMF